MYVLDVIPLSRTAPPTPLSYRSTKPHAVGSIVSLDLRKQATFGVVVTCDPASHRKAELKSAHYTLRSSRDAVAGALPEWFMNAAQQVAHEYATTIGSILTLLLADVGDVADQAISLPPASTGTESVKKVYVENVLSVRENKYREILASIDSASASSVLFVVPTTREVTYWKRVLGKQKNFSVLVTTPEKSLTAWANNPPSIVMLERVGSGSYTLPKRPYVNARTVHTLFATAWGATLVLGDAPLPIEVRPEPDAPLITTEQNLISVVDARRDSIARTQQQTESDGPWRVIPERTAKLISDAIASGERVLLLGVRTGYAPSVVCRDCGQAVVDERGRALTFSMEKGERIFRSVDGVTSRPADTACARCGSWHLVPLGVGVERILEEAQERWSDAPVAYLPPDVVKTTKKSREALRDVEQGGIIIGTEAMLPLVLNTFGIAGCSLGVVVSADSLLALPFWRSRERFIRLVYFFEALCKKTVVVTRRPEDTALAALSPSTAASALNSSFFQEETSLRKAIGYPPFGTLIRISREGSPAALDRLDSVITDAIGNHTSHHIPDAAVRGAIFRRTTILMIPAGKWPDVPLAEKLASLPPTVRVQADPESLW